MHLYNAINERDPCLLNGVAGSRFCVDTRSLDKFDILGASLYLI